MLAGSGGGWGWRMVACQPGSAIREPVRYYQLVLRKLYSFETGENELPKHTRMDGWLIAIAQTRHTSENENDIAHTTDGHTHTFNKKRGWRLGWGCVGLELQLSGGMFWCRRGWRGIPNFIYIPIPSNPYPMPVPAIFLFQGA